MKEILSNVVDRKFSGDGDLVFDSINEWNSSDDVGQVFGTVQQSPSLRSRFHELIDHRQAGSAGAVALGLAVPQPHGGERALDGVGGPQVNPVLGREVVERQEHVAIFLQAFDRFGVLGTIRFQEGVEGLLGLHLLLGHPDLMELLLGRTLQALG